MWLTLELLDAAHNYKPKLESKLEGGVISLKNESNNEQMDLIVSEGVCLLRGIIVLTLRSSSVHKL